MNRAVLAAENDGLLWDKVLVVFLFVGLAALTAVLAGVFPIQYSIAAVFLFAGPHNWIEARYFLTKMPPKLGRLRRFFVTAGIGVVFLSAAHASLPFLAHRFEWTRATWELGLAVWCSSLVGWTLSLVWQRSQQGPRRDWGAALPIGLLVISLCWLQPQLSLLSLVYLHPLVGFWILDREISANHPQLRSTFRVCIASIPIAVLWLAWRFSGASDIIAETETSMWIVGQVGSRQLPFLSSHFLVATHAFLETLHYAVWLIAIPLASGRVFTFDWKSMPLTRSAGGHRHWVAPVLALGAFIVIALWCAFSLDYSLTRTIYFNVAMLHVLAEVPFLLRQL